MICVGGTFDIIHAGHRALLEKAFSLGDEVVIGLATDELASGKGRRINPYEERLKALEEYLDSMGFRADIRPLDDEVGECLNPECTALVVSEETLKTARRLNSTRKERRLPPMEIHVVPYLLADDFRPISSSRIAAGEIDADGRLLRPLRVAVGSVNPNKVEAVRSALSRFYESTDVRGFRVDSGVPDQPFDTDTERGAMNRARDALHAWNDADIGVGIEAGLIHDSVIGEYLDVQYCAILDRSEWMTVGHGPGFFYPKKVMAHVSEGKDIGDAMKHAYGTENVGYREGAIGFLTRGKYTRKELSESAVVMAFVPRVRMADYLGSQSDSYK